MSWSAKQYVAFEDERTRPARDLLAAIPAVDARSVIDVGCGPANSTQLLVERFPGAMVRGLDSSGDMIEAARKRLPQVRFDQADIANWNEAGPFDVIFANAVLQWLPDHATLLPSLATRLTPGGSLAIQMPDTLNQPSHRLMREIAADGPWASKLSDASAQRTQVAAASDYYAMLKQVSNEKTIGRISGYAWGLGYVGGILLLMISLVGFISADNPWLGIGTENSENIRAVFLFSGIWTLVFSIPMLLRVPEIPRKVTAKRESILRSYAKLWQQLKSLHAQAPETLKFLISSAWAGPPTS